MTLLFDTAIVKEGGAEPVIESLNITPTAQQQVIEAPSGVDGYSPITVAAAAQPVIQSLSITPSSIQQTFTASGGVDGYSPITVAAIPQDDEPEILYGQGDRDPEYAGELIFSSTMLKNLFETNQDAQDDDDAYLALTSCSVHFEYDNNDQIIYLPSFIDVGYLYIHGAATLASLELNSTHISNKPSKLYILMDTNYAHGYLDIYTTLPGDLSLYQKAWSCDATYDDNTPAFNLSNFQKIK